MVPKVLEPIKFDCNNIEYLAFTKIESNDLLQRISDFCCKSSYPAIIAIYQGPRIQSFLKVKVTLTLREIILRHDIQHLISVFDLVLCLIDKIHL